MRRASLVVLAVATAVVTAVTGSWLAPGGTPTAERAEPVACAPAVFPAVEPETAELDDGLEVEETEAAPRAESAEVTLRVRYSNGAAPRGLLLARENDKPIVARGVEGVFRVELKPGAHRVRWHTDTLALHPGDPLALGEPEFTIDTRDPRTWDLTVPVAAQVRAYENARGLPELWRDGAPVKTEWEYLGSRHGGPAYLSTSCLQDPVMVALVEPGTYTIRRGMTARTVALDASEPFCFAEE